MAQNPDINVPQTYTVRDIMIPCRINDTDQQQGMTPA